MARIDHREEIRASRVDCKSVRDFFAVLKSTRMRPHPPFGYYGERDRDQRLLTRTSGRRPDSDNRNENPCECIVNRFKQEESKMKLKHGVICLVILLSLVMAINALASGHGSERPMKTGILLVAFGSSVPEAQVSFDKIDQAVKKTFKDTPVRWAYTSAIIRNKLAKEGKQRDSVATALAKMMDEGFTHVAVQSLHTIPGEEYEDLVHTVHGFQDMPEGFDQIVIGTPMLYSEEDVARVTETILANCPKERKPGEALVLMGHGTPHPANAFYAALMFQLQRKDPNVFVGTVEGTPLIEDIVDMLKEKNIKKVYLMPFMSVAGDHARNDMSGPEDDSWKSILTKAGIESHVTLKGTAEYDNMTAIWIDHLKTVMEHFSK